jgi:hypothetical protein
VKRSGLLWSWLLATLAGALWLGLLGRGVMSLIALAAGQSPRWTWDGTRDILIMGAIVSAVVTALWMGLRRVVPFLRRGRGALPGALVFLGFMMIPPPTATSALAGIGLRGLSTVLFGLLLVGFGMTIESILLLHERDRAPTQPPT